MPGFDTGSLELYPGGCWEEVDSGTNAIGTALALLTAFVAAAVDAPLALLVPLFVVAGVLSMSWNGLAYAAAAEAAGPARTARSSTSIRRTSLIR